MQVVSTSRIGKKLDQLNGQRMYQASQPKTPGREK